MKQSTTEAPYTKQLFERLGKPMNCGPIRHR
jgi:hypothetical protein